MKLLNELIGTLASEKPSLTDALMKTKVLLHKLGRKDLASGLTTNSTGIQRRQYFLSIAPAVPADRVGQRERLKRLLDSGALTQQEFDREKAKILSTQ